MDRPLIPDLGRLRRRVSQQVKRTGPVMADMVAWRCDQAQLGTQGSRVADRADGVECGAAQLEGPGELAAGLSERRPGRKLDEPPGSRLEEIARLVGHSSTRTTEIVYRRELRPVITTGAQIMDQFFTGT
jgi:hypothetical protein